MLSLLAALALSPAHAAPPPAGNFGLGLGGGLGVSGLSGKLYVSQGSAFQGVIGVWGVGRDGDDGLGVSLDYLYEMPTFTTSAPVDLGWNVGFGGALGVADDPFVGVSGVAGLEFLFNPVPLDLVLEYRPGLRVSPGVGLDLVNFTGHLRYWF